MGLVDYGGLGRTRSCRKVAGPPMLVPESCCNSKVTNLLMERGPDIERRDARKPVKIYQTNRLCCDSNVWH
jgi:hypothetical protein